MSRLLEVYSKGFFDTLTKEDLEREVGVAKQLITNNHQKDLRNFFKNKTIRKEEKLTFAQNLVGESKLKALVNTLNTNNRHELIPEIFNHFIKYASKRQNKIPVKVTTNKEPSDEIKTQVKNFIFSSIGPETPIQYEVKKSLIGGIIIKHKDNEIDLSIDNKLNGLREALIN